MKFPFSRLRELLQADASPGPPGLSPVARHLCGDEVCGRQREDGNAERQTIPSVFYLLIFNLLFINFSERRRIGESDQWTRERLV